ncbi:DUF885 domain-containing protein [Sphingomonas sp.]|uniref:DUF885 domain-containing protein n=1 Tax=Sphingomonas sp. TaxID=28214 RepID=UPI003B3B298E
MRVRVLLLCAIFYQGCAAAAAAAEADRSWIATSDRDTQLLLTAQAAFNPETASQSGAAIYDGRAIDLGPKLEARRAAALQPVLQQLEQRLAQERNPRIQEDLRILIQAAQRDLEDQRLQRRYFVAWTDAPNLMFKGISGLLDQQVSAERRGKALELLRRYVGDWPGTTPLVEQAKARFVETRTPGVRGPDRTALNDAITNAGTYARGIRKLFETYHIAGAEPALAKLDAQVAEYTAWEETVVLPISRRDFHLPAEVYAFRLKTRGIDIPPSLLMQQARVEFAETRAAMIALAPQVAREKGWTLTRYQDVIGRIKTMAIPRDKLESTYAEVMARNEAVIRRERIVDLPDRPTQMRIATDAEAAASPAPHMQAPRMINNNGEHGVFVLTSGVGGTDPNSAYDDFNSLAVAWTVAAHEARPGHELQFSAMAQRGVSQARAIYAFNSVNVEGWALYAEAEALPYHPLDGQLMALQARLLRAARAMLDPMLNLGMISIEDARRVLIDQACQSPAMARQEIERYTSRAPGQAGSYFYGYTRLLQLRMEAELALGNRFDRLAFNNFVLDQGLVSPDLLAKAVREIFIPTVRAAPVQGG